MHIHAATRAGGSPMDVRTAARVLGLVCVVAGPAAPVTAEAARARRVPQQYATIQAAVDAAAPGDEITVAPGAYCGAVIDRPVTLVGLGHPTIVGCADGPVLFGGLRAGFFLPGAA